MFNTLSVKEWLLLPSETRAKLKKVFKIKKSGGAYVENNIVKSDGHTEEDLEGISIEKMKAFTKLKSDDFIELFKKTIDLINKEK